MEGFEFSFGEGEMPEELEQLLHSLVRKTLDTGVAHDPHDDEIRPSSLQLAIGPGDLVAITHSTEPADAEFMIAQVLTPEEHADTFPDWEDRLLKSFLLVKWFSKNNKGGSLGWVARAKLVQVDQPEYEEMMNWIQSDMVSLDEGPPPWLVARYNESLAAMAKVNPDHIAEPIRCPKCGSYAVLITLVHEQIRTMAMGLKPDDHGKGVHEVESLYVVAPYGKSQNFTTKLRCYDCNLDDVLPDELGLFGDQF